MDFRNQFDFQNGLIHLNNAGVTPLTQPCAKIMAEKSHEASIYGFHGYEKLVLQLDSARKRISDFIKVKPDNLAFVHNCSTAISLMAFGLPFKRRNQILITDQEYPSNRYPWFSRAKIDDLEIVEFPSEKNGSINWDKFIGRINFKTRAVVVSWVQYSTGVRAPLKEISERAHRIGAWVVVDVIQGLGVIPFDFQEMGVDAICCGSHKWLCGPLGHGFLALKPELCREVYPVVQGAFTFANSELPFDKSREPHASALRFESGAPNYFGTLGLAESVRVIQEIGIESIYEKAMSLRSFAMETALAQGLEVKGEASEEFGSPIVVFVPKGDVESYATKLKDKKISFAIRSGGIRISPHAFNTREEVNLAIL